MIGAETIQQILVALVLLAPAITIELREQVRVIARDNIGLPRVALVQLRIPRAAIAIIQRVRFFDPFAIAIFLRPNYIIPKVTSLRSRKA